MTFKIKLISAKLFKDWHLDRAIKTPIKNIYLNHLAQATFWSGYIEETIKKEERGINVKTIVYPTHMNYLLN